MSNDAPPLRILLSLVLMTLWGTGLPLDQPLATSASTQEYVETCAVLEECFKGAALPKERLGKTLTKDQVLSLKLDRLKRIMERFPATLWAKRAGLLSGVLLIERNPAVAIEFLRGAQRDFPPLDDYVRLWIGEALLNLGDAKQAAEQFASIPREVPDSNILTRAAYRTGEAWYQVPGCAEAIEWFERAVRLSDKESGTPQALLRRAACQLKDNKIADGRETLKQLWARFPYTAEGKEAREGSGLPRTGVPCRGDRRIEKIFGCGAGITSTVGSHAENRHRTGASQTVRSGTRNLSRSSKKWFTRVP